MQILGEGKMKENWKNGKAPRMKFLETDEGGRHADEGMVDGRA